jgi:hypothetical protein
LVTFLLVINVMARELEKIIALCKPRQGSSLAPTHIFPLFVLILTGSSPVNAPPPKKKMWS